MRNDDRFGNLPWGWQLRVRGSVLEDEQGRAWESVREAFWQGRLGFPDVHFVPEQIELMLRVLTAIDAQWCGGVESQNDLFGGDMLFWRFYQCWLTSIGMLDRAGPGSVLQARLSAEGRSAMLMLQATREPAWEAMPMADVVDAVRSAGRDPASVAREAMLDAFERQVAHRRCVFARERIGNLRLVTLMGIGTGARLPLRRVMWSQSFTDDVARDDLFAWLAGHVDRWDDWGELAYSRGPSALTARFLTLLVGGRCHPAARSD